MSNDDLRPIEISVVASCTLFACLCGISQFLDILEEYQKEKAERAKQVYMRFYAPQPADCEQEEVSPNLSSSREIYSSFGEVLHQSLEKNALIEWRRSKGMETRADLERMKGCSCKIYQGPGYTP